MDMSQWQEKAQVQEKLVKCPRHPYRDVLSEKCLYGDSISQEPQLGGGFHPAGLRQLLFYLKYQKKGKIFQV